MVNMLERRNVAVAAYGDVLLNDEEFLLLYDLNSSSSIQILIWIICKTMNTYQNFDS